MRIIRHILIIIIGITILLSCSSERDPDGSNISSADYTYSQPQFAGSSLAVSTLTVENIDETEIVNVVKDILDDRYGGIDSLLIARNGALVLERYFNGFNRNKKHDIRSATKSIAGLLAGIAIDKGYLPDTNIAIYDYFTRYDRFDFWSSLKNEITLQHVLSMSGGWECNDSDKSSLGNEDRMYRYQDWAKFILDLPMNNQPGNVFSYCTGGIGLIGDIIGYSSNMDVADFATEYLFTPLGISDADFHFRTDPAGRTHVGGQMHLTPLAMLKIGQLLLNDGIWNGNQIVSNQWITATKTPYFPWYSNTWWIWSGMIEAIGADVTFHYANGNGGQNIFVVPAYDLVVVFTAHEYNNSAAGNGRRILINRIIPAMN